MRSSRRRISSTASAAKPSTEKPWRAVVANSCPRMTGDVRCSSPGNFVSPPLTTPNDSPVSACSAAPCQSHSTVRVGIAANASHSRGSRSRRGAATTVHANITMPSCSDNGFCSADSAIAAVASASAAPLPLPR